MTADHLNMHRPVDRLIHFGKAARMIIIYFGKHAKKLDLGKEVVSEIEV